MTSCAQTKYVPEGSYLLDKVKIEVDGNYREFNSSKAKAYVRQQDNVRWFSMVKLPLHTYSLSGRDSTKWVNRLLRSMGEAPVLYDSLKAAQTCNDLQQMLRNSGYLDGRVELWTRTKGKKLSAVYRLLPGEPYYIGIVNYDIRDSVIARELRLNTPANWGLREGQQFSVDDLDAERKRLTKILNDRGYGAT